MKQRFIFSTVALVGVGVLQIWACVSLLGLLAAYSSAHGFFGFSVYAVLVAEHFIAYVPTSVLIGFLVGNAIRSNAVQASLVVATSAFLWLLISGAELWLPNGTLVQAAKTIAFAFATSGVFLFLATPIGALLALRYKAA
jgi:hypothetical protein